MRALLDVIMLALQLYIWLLIASAVMSWLVAFGVVNSRIMPNLGGIDISPIILLLIIFLIQGWIRDYLYPLAF